MKWSKAFAIVFLAVLLVLALSSCGLSAPSERELIELIPSEIIQYTLEGEEYMPQVSQLEILRQQLSEKDCIIECKISLEDENLSRQEYIQLNCTYWDKGGWDLESWEELQRPECTPLVSLSEDRFLSYFERLGYSSENFEPYVVYDEDGHLQESMAGLFDGTLMDNSPTRHCTVYQVYDPHENITVSGMVPITGLFIISQNFPRDIFWSIEADTSWLSYDWTVSGKWHCEFSRKVEHWFKYITKQYSVDVDLQLGYANYVDGDIFFPVQGRFSINGEESEALNSWDYAQWSRSDDLCNMRLVYDGLYSTTFNNDDSFHGKINFYPDYAELCIVKSTWSSGDYEAATYDFYRI